MELCQKKSSQKRKINYLNRRLLELWASGGIEDTYVRGAYDSNVVKVQVLSRPPLSKLHGSRSCTRCCVMRKKLR